MHKIKYVVNKTLFSSSVNVIGNFWGKGKLVYKRTEIENKLIDKIDEILNDFEDFEQPFINNSGDIIIRKKLIKRKTRDSSILTNIFKEMIKNDVKKNRV